MPRGDRGTSTHPVKRFSKFHCDSPCRSNTKRAIVRPLEHERVCSQARAYWNRCPSQAVALGDPDRTAPSKFLTTKYAVGMTVSTLLWTRSRQKMLLVTDCACLCGRRNFSS